VDLRDGDTLDDLVGPFDKMAHSADVRSVNANHFSVFGNIPDIDGVRRNVPMRQHPCQLSRGGNALLDYTGVRVTMQLRGRRPVISIGIVISVSRRDNGCL
jgi:hypothetical protein